MNGWNLWDRAKIHHSYNAYYSKRSLDLVDKDRVGGSAWLFSVSLVPISRSAAEQKLRSSISDKAEVLFLDLTPDCRLCGSDSTLTLW